MNILKRDTDVFEEVVSKHFSFMEADLNLQFVGVTIFDSDPRDSYMVAKFQHDAFRVDVAWNPVAMSLSVLICIENDDLRRREKYLYFEPFIEFTSNGDTIPIVPQIYPGMSVRKIEKAMELRQNLFADGIEGSICLLASKLKEHLSSIRSCNAKTVREYQAWYQTRGKTG